MSITLALAFALQASGSATGPTWRPETYSVLDQYGVCLAEAATLLERSAEAADQVIGAAITSCEKSRSSAFAAIVADLKRRPEQWYRDQPDANAEKVLTFIEQKMRENLALQIIQRRALRKSYVDH